VAAILGQACKDERPYACPYLEDVLSSFCRRGSRWACNDRGIFEAQRASPVRLKRL